MFTIYSDNGSDSTMVSNLFIDEYMERANDAQIKIYLYLLRVMGTHKGTSVSDLADRFNHTEKDVVRSLRYWERQGLLNLRFSEKNDLVSICLCRPSSAANTEPGNRVLNFSSIAESALKDSPEESSGLLLAAGGSAFSAGSAAVASAMSSALSPDPERRISMPAAEKNLRDTRTSTPTDRSAKTASAGTSAPLKAGDLEALNKFRDNPDRARLLFVIEQYIGKPLSLNEIRIIYNISENLGFSDDMVDYLLQYCVDRGKKDFRYIGKVAENWSKDGIMTPAQAEAYSSAVQEELPGKKAGKNTDKKAAFRQTGKSSARGKGPNSFNQFEQNSYDFDALEEELLSSLD